MLDSIFNAQTLRAITITAFGNSILLAIAMAVVTIFDLHEMKGAWVFPLLFTLIIMLTTTVIVWLGIAYREAKHFSEDIK